MLPTALTSEVIIRKIQGRAETEQCAHRRPEFAGNATFVKIGQHKRNLVRRKGGQGGGVRIKTEKGRKERGSIKGGGRRKTCQKLPKGKTSPAG